MVRGVNPRKDKLMCQLRKEVESGNVNVRALFEFFYGDIAKASARNIKEFLATHKKLGEELNAN